MASPTSPAYRQSSVSSSFPNPLNPVPESYDASSVVSSRMTDIVSEDGEDYRPQSRMERGLQSSAGEPTTNASVGDPITGPSRPSSAATGVSSTRGAWSQPPPSRRGILPAGYGGISRGNTAVTTATGNRTSSGVSRPQSAASRTHVPSLTSHAFFRPMSSQRLQAQRGGRPSAIGQFGSSEDGYSEQGSNANRQSVGSNPTSRQPLVIHQDSEMPPPSRGTEITEREGLDRATGYTSPTGIGTARSLSESVRPLQDRSSNQGPFHLDLGKNYKNGTGMMPTPQKSPRSFRSSFLLPSKSAGSGNEDTRGREKLSSAGSSPRSAPIKPQQQLMENSSRNYQYFSGNTVFCLGGRLQNARHAPINIATGLIVAIPGALFLGFSAPWLWLNVCPAIPILFAYIFMICLSSFVHASVSDPGILPRNLHSFPPSDNAEDPLALGPPTTDWTRIRSATSSKAAMEVPTKYCKTCNIWRPPRGHHCRVCNNCIETQDHHCVWLNNCVGRRNYRYFFTFVSSGTIIGFFLFAASLAHILAYRSQQRVSFGKAIDTWRVPFAMVIYSVLATPYPLALWSYHLFLTGRGETTREYLNSHKFLRKDRHRPFTQGIALWNWIFVLGRPRPPTYLHFKRKYVEGDQRFGSRRQKTVHGEQSGEGLELSHVGGAKPSFQGPGRRRLWPNGQGKDNAPREELQ
ncbi:MAG: Eukaryotic peptide chain release factor GTP-binding subunit [Pycnora praestabilis]|nr:MAG: Eukaryotic peptide chain release factor GTP-binding subunit [Pycnora praestabilis]